MKKLKRKIVKAILSSFVVLSVSVLSYNAYSATCIIDEEALKICIDDWVTYSNGQSGLTKICAEPLPDEEGPACSGEF